MIGIAVDQEEVAVGQLLTGNIMWSGPGGVASCVVTLEWRTEGVGNPRFAIVKQIKQSASGTDVVPFRMKIPNEGPVTFSGTNLSVRWRLSAEVRPERGTMEQVENEVHVVPAARIRA